MTEAHRTEEQVTYQVTFAGVGRSKKNWISTLQQCPTPAILERLVRKSGALMSRDVECVLDEDEEHGTIYAGMRPVGAFQIKSWESRHD